MFYTGTPMSSGIEKMPASSNSSNFCWSSCNLSTGKGYSAFSLWGSRVAHIDYGLEFSSLAVIKVLSRIKHVGVFVCYLFELSPDLVWKLEIRVSFYIYRPFFFVSAAHPGL